MCASACAAERGVRGSGARADFRVCSPWRPTSAHPSPIRCRVVDVLEVLLAPPNREFLQFGGEAGRECNLRRTEGEKGGRGSNPALSRLGLGTFFPPARQASPPAPPASRPWACSPGSAARHWGPRGLGGSPGRARGRTEGREGRRLRRQGAGARQASPPSLCPAEPVSH